MSFMAQQEVEHRSSLAQKLGGAPDEGALTAFSRLAMNSLRAAELPGLDAFLPSKDGDSIKSSDGGSSSDPDSPRHLGREFDHPKIDPRDAVRDPREGRRRGSFMRRLVHR